MDILEFYRTETYHPVTVHWPIVLLSIGSFFYIFGYFRKNYFLDSGRVLIILGTAGAWLAIYTGNLADGVVGRQICDPTVLKSHENYAYYTAYVFSVIIIVEFLLQWLGVKHWLKQILHWILMATMLTGLVLLTYVGHLGGSLVFDQAAGVTVPSEDCKGFE